MPLPLIAGLIIGGAAAKIGGNVLSNANTRKENREAAENQKNVNDHNTATALGNMENELRAGMGEDYIQAGDIDRRMNAESTANMQNTYMGQLSAENQYMGLLANNERAMGELTSSMGSSGAKQDVNLQTVINRELTEEAAGKRQQIDKGLNLSTYQNKIATDEMKDQTNRLRNKYEDGSAVMSIYNYRRERTQGLNTMQNSYLDDIIKDNKYNWNWFAADLLGGASVAFDAGAYGVTQGAW